MVGVALEHHRAGRLTQAAQLYRRVLQVEPNHLDALHLAGTLAHEVGEDDAALELIGKRIAVDPNYTHSHLNLGIALAATGRIQKAIASYGRALALTPDYAEAHFALSLMLLLVGDFQRGWEEWEWRLRCERYVSKLPPIPPAPRWNGEHLGGRRILLWAEGGFGDTIQFARYAPLVAASSGRVLLASQPELVRLLRSLPGVERVLATRDRPPHVDAQAPLMSLPLLLGTTLSTIPADVPYLSGGRPVRRRPAPPGLRVGLAWAGRRRNIQDLRRSLPLAALAPLGRVPSVRFYALQKGPSGMKANTPPEGMELTDLAPRLRDFTQTAAVISQLDLVISVDTAVAHLAGALGKPVWVLLPSPPEWRWLLDRRDSPWYPTARLFRQELPGDWAGVVARVASALEELSATGVDAL